MSSFIGKDSSDESAAAHTDPAEEADLFLGPFEDESPAATPSWPERVIVDDREIPVVIDPMLPDHVGAAEWNLDFQGNPTTPKRIVLRAREERVLLHEVLHCLLGDNEALVRRATLLYDLGWRLPMVARACECDAPRCERDGCQDRPTQ